MSGISNTIRGGLESLKSENATPSKSKALVYHVQLQEVFDNYPNSPCRERARICFEMLDNLIPHTGSYESVLKIVRDELKKTVYSPSVTAIDKEPFYENIPYCVLMDRINNNRATGQEKLEAKIEELTQKLKFRDEDLEIVHKKNLHLKQKIDLFERNENGFRSEIHQLKMELFLQESESKVTKSDFQKTEEKLQKEILVLQNAFNQAKRAIDKLTACKYPNEEETEALQKKQNENSKRNNFELSSKGMLSFDLAQSKQVERQFSEMLDYLLDDFEMILGQIYRKRDIMMGVSSKENPNTVAIFSNEINDAVASFKLKIDKYLQESGLLKRHINGLLLQMKKNEASQKLPSLDSTSDICTKKYSVVFTVSEDGEKFKSHEASQFCAKCGERVIACPHLYLGSKVIELDQKIRKIKFEHPQLQLKSDFTMSSENEKALMSDVVTEDENPLVSASFYRIWKDFYSIRKGFKPSTGRLFSIERILEFIQDIYDIRWNMEEEWLNKSKKEKNKQEDIGQENLLQDNDSSQKVNSNSLHQESLTIPENNNTPAQNLGNSLEKLMVDLPSFTNFFYDLMNSRYVYKEISIKAIHDIFTSIEKYEKVNYQITLFAQHVAGLHQDAWKYLELAKKLFSYNVKKIDKATYRNKMKILYPNRPDEIYEQMEMEFIAFSSNRLSYDAMVDHLIYLMSKETEPNFVFFLRHFDRIDKQLNGFMAYSSFVEVITKMIPNTPLSDIDTRYKLAEIDYGPDRVSIEKLAYMASHLMLNNAYQTEWKLDDQISPIYTEFKTATSSEEID